MFDQDKMDIDFKEKTAVIKAEGEKSKQAVSYNFSNKEVLNCKTKNSSNYKKQLNAEASFCISKDDLKKLVKSAAIMGLHHLNIKATDGEIVLTLLNKNDDTGNKYSLTMEGQGSCNIIISVDSLIFLDGDYAIEVKDGACIRATHAQLPLFYIVTAHKV
jgi:hypothetical protein